MSDTNVTPCCDTTQCTVTREREELRKLSDDLKDLKDRLEPVIEVWESLTGMVKVLAALGHAIKWGAMVAAAIAAILAAIKLGGAK